MSSVAVNPNSKQAVPPGGVYAPNPQMGAYPMQPGFMQVQTPTVPMPFPPQPPAHPSVMWGPLGAHGPCGVPAVPGINSLTPGYDGYHGFPGYVENPQIRMNKGYLHYGGWGVVNTQPLAWSAAFNPYNRLSRTGYTGDVPYLNGDSMGDRRNARINRMRALLDTPPVGSFFDATYDRR